ncbi:unnamed protein product [Ascophyllum nodosum]
MSGNSRREIITLQVGRYANFVGTHFWNFQDELLLLRSRGGVVDAYDHGVLHRASTSEGGACTPRVVAFDTRDALGYLNPLGLVGGTGASTATPDAALTSWASGVSVFRQPELKKNALHTYLDAEEDQEGGDDQGGGADADEQGKDDGDWGDVDDSEDTRVTGQGTRLSSHPFGLDDSVSTWPDFLKSRLHPRALQELPFRDASSEFGLYTAGSGGGGGSGSVLGEGDREEHLNKLRRQLEECDAPQGTQTFADMEGGWGGLSCALAEELRQECKNRPRVCYSFSRREDAAAAPGCRLPDPAGGGGGPGSGSRRGAPDGGAAASRSAVNRALALHGLEEAFSMVCLLDEEACAQTWPHVRADPRNAYHTSAILGAAVDVATSPLRFSSTRLDEWASAGGDYGGGRVWVGTVMPLASMSAWLPFPSPDASAEMLRKALDPPPSRVAASGGGHHPRIAGSVGGQAGALDGMLSLGPTARHREMVPRPGGTSRKASTSAGTTSGDIKVFSRMMVLRGLTCPRADQLGVVRQVLGKNGVAGGSSHAVLTPLPIPITYPLLFQASVGSRGEQLDPMSMGMAAESGDRRNRDHKGELRVMCDEISGIACVERSSTMGSYVVEVVEDFDLRRGGVRLELEKNDVQRDDALEVVENLKRLAERYGHEF